MKNLKSSKSKGFTLIELMVVIAIIALLSSVVLASLKSAREKAVLSKTVAEMKSLQNAIELYKNQFGVYPGSDSSGPFGIGSFYSDDRGNSYIGFYFGLETSFSLDNLIKTELVDRKLLSKVPHAPNYPNNCNGIYDCERYDGYVLGYNRIPSNNFNWKCGDNIPKNYIIYFAANNDKINLPLLSYLGSSPSFGTPVGVAPYVYCLAM